MLPPTALAGEIPKASLALFLCVFFCLSSGVNGGFFWEILNTHFLDDVCFGKLRSDAEKAVSVERPNYGIGDTLVRINGTLLSTNCDLPGFSHPAGSEETFEKKRKSP